jgi:threonine/homoserine/homoserine lactone efflux protein
MPHRPDLWLFFLMVLGVIALPGMDMAFVAGSTITRGLKGGVAALSGIVTGGLLHVGVGATGVAALLVMWPAGFNALLVAGAAYMVWVGWAIWSSASSAGATRASDSPRELGGIFRRAVVTCLLNPKAYAFMLAVFPAFIQSPQHGIAAQALRLGAIIAATQFGVYGAVAVLVASSRRWQGAGPRSSLWMARAVGAALIIGAVATPWLSWRAT